MKIAKFKTTIQSEDMALRIKPYLQNEPSISRWDVDLESEEKTLSVSGEGDIEKIVRRAADYAGFEIEMSETFAMDGRNL